MATTHHLHRLGRSVGLWCAAIASRMLRPWLPPEVVSAIRIALTCIAAIYLAMLLELDRPEWAGWTVLAVSLATRASSLQKSLWRAVSSIVGCAVAIALTANFAQSTLAFDAAIAVWLGLLTAPASVERGQRSYGFALMGYTVPIVTLGDVDQPGLIFQVAVDRCSTLLLGIACAHASSVLAASGVREVSSSLAGRLDAVATASAEWLLAVRRRGNVPEPPVSQVLALDLAVTDAFTEQPSLQTGQRAVNDAAISLLRLLAVGLLERRLGLRDSSEASALLGNHFAGADRQLRRVRSASRLLRAGRRSDNRHTMVRPLAIDRDGRLAFNNAIRTATAVSLANGFWYVSGWASGAGVVTWTALASMLLAARPNPTVATRDFLIGAALAAAVGMVVHFSVLTTSGSFPLLAAVLLPVCMLAVLGRSDARAVSGGGYGLVVLNIIGPTNVMQYQLDATLNDVVANLLGLGLAVIAFSALPPPASASTRRWRAERRMAKGFRACVRAPDWLRPDTDRWLARMFDRLTQVGDEDGATNGGQMLLLGGLLVLALRREDADLGRQVRAIVKAKGRNAGSALRQLADHADCTALQHDQIIALSLLIGAGELKFWPGLAEHAR